MKLQTLSELRAAYPLLFYGQTWYLDEPFMRVLPNDSNLAPPRGLSDVGSVPKNARGLPFAVELAHAFIREPNDPVWRGYLWCRDTDRQGQRVYVGGVTDTHGLEIHRHLHIDEKWGVPTW